MKGVDTGSRARQPGPAPGVDRVDRLRGPQPERSSGGAPWPAPRVQPSSTRRLDTGPPVTSAPPRRWSWWWPASHRAASCRRHRSALAAVVHGRGFEATVLGWTSWYGNYGLGDLGWGWCIDHGRLAPDADLGYVPDRRRRRDRRHQGRRELGDDPERRDRPGDIGRGHARDPRPHGRPPIRAGRIDVDIARLGRPRRVRRSRTRDHRHRPAHQGRRPCPRPPPCAVPVHPRCPTDRAGNQRRDHCCARRRRWCPGCRTSSWRSRRRGPRSMARWPRPATDGRATIRLRRRIGPQRLQRRDHHPRPLAARLRADQGRRPTHRPAPQARGPGGRLVRSAAPDHATTDDRAADDRAAHHDPTAADDRTTHHDPTAPDDRTADDRHRPRRPHRRHRPAAQPTADQPTADQPTTDQPTTDQPTAGQPTTDQPTTDQHRALAPGHRLSRAVHRAHRRRAAPAGRIVGRGRP